MKGLVLEMINFENQKEQRELQGQKKLAQELRELISQKREEGRDKIRLFM